MHLKGKITQSFKIIKYKNNFQEKNKKIFKIKPYSQMENE